MTTLGIGAGGWVRLDDDALPGPLYARLAPNDRGRWTVRELYLDGAGATLTPDLLRRLPVALVESWANREGAALADRLDEVTAVDLATMASAYSTAFGSVEQVRRNWLAMAYAVNLPDDMRAAAGLDDLERPRKAPGPRRRRLDGTYRLTEGPGPDGLTDDFLATVARAYAAALARGERPNAAIEADLAAAGRPYPRRTVERWVYEARRRGIMPRGRKGAAG